MILLTRVYLSSFIAKKFSHISETFPANTDSEKGPGPKFHQIPYQWFPLIISFPFSIWIMELVVSYFWANVNNALSVELHEWAEMIVFKSSSQQFLNGDDSTMILNKKRKKVKLVHLKNYECCMSLYVDFHLSVKTMRSSIALYVQFIRVLCISSFIKEKKYIIHV